LFLEFLLIFKIYYYFWLHLVKTTSHQLVNKPSYCLYWPESPCPSRFKTFTVYLGFVTHGHWQSLLLSQTHCR
jgi:hypothetical protein